MIYLNATPSCHIISCRSVEKYNHGPYCRLQIGSSSLLRIISITCHEGREKVMLLNKLGKYEALEYYDIRSMVIHGITQALIL